jgi:xylan 1,4-beta-xylosidase
LDSSGLKAGDVAGLALLNSPDAWIGVQLSDNGLEIAQYDHITGKNVSEPVTTPHVWLRVHSNFDTEISQFSYSLNGKEFTPLGPELATVFQLRTFQGVRFALFNYSTGGVPGGQADFNFFTVDEPRPRGLTKPIPVSQSIMLTDLANGNALAVVDGNCNR